MPQKITHPWAKSHLAHWRCSAGVYFGTSLCTNFTFTVLNQSIEVLNRVASRRQVHNNTRQGEKEVERDRKKGVEVQKNEEALHWIFRVENPFLFSDLGWRVPWDVLSCWKGERQRQRKRGCSHVWNSHPLCGRIIMSVWAVWERVSTHVELSKRLKAIAYCEEVQRGVAVGCRWLIPERCQENRIPRGGRK